MSESRPITKPLFEAGMQCAKRLWLDVHRADQRPEPSARRVELAAIGEQLTRLATGAFPKGEDLGGLELEEAAAKTAELLSSGRPTVILNAAFVGGGAAARVDVALSTGPGELDLFEVKAGSTVKPRHVLDVALQVHAAEASGNKVRAATLLHLDPRYVHDGGKEYPTQKLFRSVDVTERARAKLDRVKQQVEVFHSQLEDEGALDLPIGTWCKVPLPCEYFAECAKSGAEFPLTQLPYLTPKQEGRLHADGIEEITDIDDDRGGLTQQQRRVVTAVQEDRLIVEPFIATELADVDWPLAFVHIGWHVEVLPRFVDNRPWQKLPFVWSLQRLEEDGTVTSQSMSFTAAGDPADEVLSSLTTALQDCGTLVIYEHGLDERLRSMLEDRRSFKPQLRTLLQLPLFELGNLIQHGVYHPDFRGDFDLRTVAKALDLESATGNEDLSEALAAGKKLPIDSAEDAEQVFPRLLNSRTRATTRAKLGADLEAWSLRHSARCVALYRLLREAGQGDTTEADESP